MDGSEKFSIRSLLPLWGVFQGYALQQHNVKSALIVTKPFHPQFSDPRIYLQMVNGEKSGKRVVFSFDSSFLHFVTRCFGEERGRAEATALPVSTV